MTLELDIEDRVLAKAESWAEERGTSIKQAVTWYIEALSERSDVRSLEDALHWARARGFYVETPLPSREERMSR
jgi:hypothetical protein